MRDDLLERPLLTGLDDGESREMEPVRAFTPQGRLLFEHFPQSGKSVVHVTSGDLEFRVGAGAIHLVARDGVHLRSENAAQASAISVTPASVNVSGPRIQAAAREAHLCAGSAQVVLKAFNLIAEKSSSVVGVVEIKAERILERANVVQREVRDLLQTRAGRIREIAKTTYQLLAQRAVVKAQEDLKLKSDKKIHLA
jgi:hypothetical protein